MEVHGAARAAAAVERIRVPPHINARVEVQMPALLRSQAHLHHQHNHLNRLCQILSEIQPSPSRTNHNTIYLLATNVIPRHLALSPTRVNIES